MYIYIFIAIYFAVPIAAMFTGPTFELCGRVWLFNLVSLFFWPILMWFVPPTYR